MRSATFSRLLVLAVLVSATFAFTQAGDTLTNDAVVKMVRAELSTRIILTTIQSAPSVTFDLSPSGLIALKAEGVDDQIITAMQARVQGAGAAEAAREKSEALATSKEPDIILRNFKTMLVSADKATFFGTDQMLAALRKDKGFAALKITIVDHPSVADVVLEVGYTFAWDYPFSLKHQNTSVVLVSGRGTGPFSGPAGATSVASEFVKLLKPYRGPSSGGT
jgi:hypothetical protein